MEKPISLPTGTVTFLFTDIEGSTRLWEEHPEAMRRAVMEHNQLLREAIEADQGAVFKSVGDGFCAVFADTSDALSAALHIQQALQAQSWPTDSPLRVRLALNTDGAEIHDGEYLGPSLNRVARLLAAGHGGQVLLCQNTADLVQDKLPIGASLRDLGHHRLRDLQRPEHIFQLIHTDLPSDFPPLKSLGVLPNRLPVQLTSFIGRVPEMAALRRHLATSRLVTLTGAGGCGKTRLALQVAAELLEEYADGVWLVELAALSDPGLVAQTIASALGVREEPGRPPAATLADYLRAKSILLLLDNCEHLLSACAQLVESLLRICPNLRILATGREALGILGEQTYRVPSLSAPAARRRLMVDGDRTDRRPSTLDHQPSALLQYEAVRLFVDRALLIRPTFQATDQNALSVAQIGQRLDGIPLAIELAAAWVRMLSVEEIAARLDDRFRLLTGGSRTALPRQQTLRATMDWSYDLL